MFSRSRTTSDEGGFSAGNGNINATNGVSQVAENIQLLGGGSNTYDQLLKLGHYNSSNVPAQRVRWNGVYDLPFGRGRKWRGCARALNHLIGGWQIATIGEWRGGNWLSVTAGEYLSGDPTLSAGQRLLMTFAGRAQRLWFRGDFNPRWRRVDQQALLALVPANQADRVLRPADQG